VRRAHQGLREAEAHAPAARKLADRPVVLLRRETEAVQQLSRTGARRVPVRVLVAKMRVRDPLAIRLRLRGFDGPLRGAELPVPVQHELDGRPAELRELLGHVRDDPVLRYRYG